MYTVIRTDEDGTQLIYFARSEADAKLVQERWSKWGLRVEVIKEDG